VWSANNQNLSYWAFARVVLADNSFFYYIKLEIIKAQKVQPVVPADNDYVINLLNSFLSNRSKSKS
jgi:hypothetical protein